MWQVILFVVSLVLQYLFRKTPSGGAQPGEFEANTAEEGTNIGVLFGTREIEDLNCVWWGHSRAYPREDHDVVQFYWYDCGAHHVACLGPIDSVLSLSFADDESYSGVFAGGDLSISKRALFGGDPPGGAGGVEGTFSILMGYPGQEENEYLEGQLGNTPAWEGVVSIVSERPYVGTSPYFPQMSIIGKRINVTDYGETQWYDEKAAVGDDADAAEVLAADYLFMTSDGWKYLIISLGDYTDYSDPDYDDSGWTDGQMPFGNNDEHPYVAENGFPQETKTYWQLSSILWLRKTFYVSPAHGITIDIFVDNHVSLWVNGIQLLSNVSKVTGYTTVIIGKEYLNIGANDIAIKCLDDGGWSYASIRISAEDLCSISMNPAHMIRELYVSKRWGRGVDPDTTIDNDSFTSSADYLYDEGFGLSFFWNDDKSAGDVGNDILEQIDGVVRVDNTTGLLQLKLIRDDYDVENLVNIEESDVVTCEDFTRPSPEDLINEIIIKYWDYSIRDTSTVTVHNTARIQNFGLNSKTITLNGVINRTIATRVASRELIKQGSGLVSCTLKTKRKGYLIQKGDAFVLTYSKRGISEIVMRALEVDYGDGTDNTVSIVCTQDIFSLPEYSAIGPDETAWEDPVQPPDAIEYRLAIEAPYAELIRNSSKVSVDAELAANDDLGRLAITAVREQEIAQLPELWTDNGGGYVHRGNASYCPSAVLGAAIGKTDESCSLANGIGIDEVSGATFAYIGGEFVVATLSGTTSATLTRGVIDTIPAEHAAADRMFFIGNLLRGDGIDYSAEDSIGVKLLPLTSLGTLNINNATADNVVFDSRAARPYPPANVTINGEYWPSSLSSNTVTIAWAHRDRTQQEEGEYIGWFGGSVGPEIGTTYTATWYLDGAQVSQETGITGVSSSPYTYTSSGTASVELKAVCDGKDSFQVYSHSWSVEIYITVDDDFTGDNNDPPNSERWEPVETSGNATFDIQSNALTATHSVSGIGTVSFISKFQLEGDFDIQVDFAVNGANTQRWVTQFMATTGDAYSNDLILIDRRYDTGTVIGYLSTIKKAGTPTSDLLASTTMSGKLRLVRNGTIATTYAYVSDAWVEIDSLSGFTENDLYVMFRSLTTTTPQAYTSAYDNFTVNSADSINWPV